MSPCPSADQLRQFLAEQLGETTWRAVEAHVEGCLPCQEAVAQLLEGTTVRLPRPEHSPAGDLPPADVRFLKSLMDAPPPAPGPEGNDDEPPTAIPFPGPATAQGPLGRLGTYHIVKELGRGGMGVVFQALDEHLGHLVAIKVLKPELAALERARVRFEREGRRAAAVKDDHVVAVYQAGSTAEFALPFLVMEYIDGETLGGRLRRHERLPPAEAARIVRQVAQGLAAAHSRNVVHRDIKPVNILLEWGSGRVKITDFGLAQQIENTSVQSAPSGLTGTVAYMSPEQILTPDRLDARTDLYSLGVVFYELLTGERPFRGVMEMVLRQVVHDEPRPPRKLNPRIPRDLEIICLKCLAKEPAKRYADAGALAEDLRRFLAGEPIQARPVTRIERTWRWCRRNPSLATASALALFGLVATVVVAVGFGVYQTRAVARIQTALEEAQRERARLARHQGYTLYEQGKVASGMLWLAGALELAPATERDLQQELRSQLAGWYRQLNPLRAVLAHPLPGGDLERRGALLELAQAFSPDGRFVLTGGQDGKALLWEVATGEAAGRLLGQHTQAVTAVGFSPDGRTAVTGSADETAQLWDVATGRPLGGPLRHQGAITALAFSPDGKLVLTGSDDHTAQLWDTATSQRHAPALGHQGRVGTVAFSPDGKLVLTGSDDHTAQLWETATGRRHGPPLQHDGRVELATFTPDGAVVLTTGRGRTVRRWETATGKPHGPALWPQGDAQAAALSPDGHFVVTGSSLGTAQLWEVRTGKPYGEALRHQGVIVTVAFSPDSRAVLTGSGDFTAKLWDVATGKLLHTFPHPMSVMAVAFAPDGRFLLTRTGEDTRLWERSQAPLPPTLVHQHWVGAVAFSPEGHRVVTGTANPSWETAVARLGEMIAGSPADRLTPWLSSAAAGVGGEARVWEAGTGRPLCPPLPHRLPIFAVAFAGDGTRFATGSGHPLWGHGEAQLWDASTATPVGLPLRHRRAVVTVAFSPDSRTLLTGSRDGTAKLWDAATGKLLRSYVHRDGILAVAFHPDGTTLLAGTEDHQVVQLDVATGQPARPPLRHPGVVVAVAVSPDGKTALTGCDDHGLRLWDLGSGAVIWVRLRHRSWIRAVAFSPDGHSCVSGSGDGTAQLWQTATGKPWGPPLRHQHVVVAAAFSPAGHAVLTGSVDRTARFWDVPPLPLEGAPEQIARWTEAITGLELDPNGEEQVLNADRWDQHRRRLEELGGPPVR
jgi:WD40 repeat protein